MFEKIFTFLIYTCFAFILITSMEDLGVAIIFGAGYMHLMIMDKKKKDKEEEKDVVN